MGIWGNIFGNAASTAAQAIQTQQAAFLAGQKAAMMKKPEPEEIPPKELFCTKCNGKGISPDETAMFQRRIQASMMTLITDIKPPGKCKHCRGRKLEPMSLVDFYGNESYTLLELITLHKGALKGEILDEIPAEES
jgi:hypothetical protein